MDRWRGARGRVHMMVDRTADRAPHLCTPPGRFPVGRGEALAAIVSRPSAPRIGTGASPGKTRRSRSEARFMSPIPRRGAPGRRRCGRRLGRRVPGRDRSWPRPSAGRSTSPSLRSALEGGEDSSWCGTVSTGGVRAGAEGGRGLGMTRSSSAAMAALTTPNNSSRAAPNSRPSASGAPCRGGDDSPSEPRARCAEARALVAESAQGLDTRGRGTAEEVAGGFPRSRYGSRPMPNESQ